MTPAVKQFTNKDGNLEVREFAEGDLLNTLDISLASISSSFLGISLGSAASADLTFSQGIMSDASVTLSGS
jgi:hypothetical protein